MKAIHPCFKYHNDNWVIQHLTIMHLFTMNKKYQQAGINPDIEIERKYFKCKTQAEAQREGHLTKRRRLGVVNTPKVHQISLVWAYSLQTMACSPLADEDCCTGFV